MIIGEFSCALSQQSLAKESNPAEARRNFCTTQMEVYANVSLLEITSSGVADN